MTQATPTTSRTAKIAALHAFADWFRDHPEAPMPTSVDATYYVFPADEPDEATRVAGVLTAMRQLDMRPTEGDTTVQGSMTIMPPSQLGMQVTYGVAAIKNDPTRYVERQHR